jgi:hypothetical protein
VVHAHAALPVFEEELDLFSGGLGVMLALTKKCGNLAEGNCVKKTA